MMPVRLSVCPSVCDGSALARIACSTAAVLLADGSSSAMLASARL